MRDGTREVDASSLRRKYRKKTYKAPKPPISHTHPEVAAQWHPRKNDLLPDDVTHGSNVRIWWLCPVHPSHEWEAAVHGRCGPDGEPRTGCPFCSGNRACVTNSLASIYPDIAAEWHRTKNEELTPETVTWGSDRRVWWQCQIDKAHVWEGNIGWRTQDQSGCPFCSNKRVCKANSLAALYPALAEEFHRKKNGDLTAWEIVPGRHEAVWWQCKQDRAHEWQTSPKSRVADSTGCPFCTGRRPSTKNNLAACYPEIANEWHPVKNGDCSPWAVVAGANKRAWWRCIKDPNHVWETRVSTRTIMGSGCPQCAALNKGPKQLSSSYNFAKMYPKIAAQWHPSRNGGLKPGDVTVGSNKRVWWKCEKGADHVWFAMVSVRAGRGSGCPFCKGKKASRVSCLAARYPEIASEWHPTKNGDLKPVDVTVGTRRKVWWRCSQNRRHVWQASIQKRTKRQQTCPSCP